MTKRLFKGYICTVIVLFATLFLLAIGLRFTNLPGECAMPLSLLCLSIATVFLGYVTGYSIGKKGLLFGLLSAIIFITFIIILITFGMSEQIAISKKYILYAIPISFGGIGGILGANKSC